MAKYTRYFKLNYFLNEYAGMRRERHLYINEYITTLHPVQMNSSLLCTVMVNDFALAPQWLPVDCKREFNATVFLCESTVADNRKKDVMKHLLLQKHVCPISYTAIKVIKKIHT